jgi:heptosyltransferase-2
MNRILVIRGAAIGDFVLTLPAIKLLRDAWPNARLEVIGYKHIVVLAENRCYADATRSIEYGPLASFFAKGADLPTELAEYFASFDLIVSYLFDPDQVFAANLRRCGNMRLVVGPAKLSADAHATVQLAAPARELGLTNDLIPAKLFPSDADHASAALLLPPKARTLIALHPGSGSSTKNWPVTNWIALIHRLAASEDIKLVVIGGEADATQIAQLRDACAPFSLTFVLDQPLNVVAAVLSRCDAFIGHDSGISHIAAAAGTQCVLLFGPTEPSVWAPIGPNVQVIRPTTGLPSDIPVDEVVDAARRLLTS